TCRYHQIQHSVAVEITDRHIAGTTTYAVSLWWLECTISVPQKNTYVPTKGFAGHKHLVGDCQIELVITIKVPRLHRNSGTARVVRNSESERPVAFPQHHGNVIAVGDSHIWLAIAVEVSNRNGAKCWAATRVNGRFESSIAVAQQYTYASGICDDY